MLKLKAASYSEAKFLVLFVFFIPSKTADGKDLPAGQEQQLWASAARKILATEFGGSTEMPPAKGSWLNEDSGEIVSEDVILVHCYTTTAKAEDEQKLERIAEFLHRMGKKTKQGEIALVIDNVFHRIRKFDLAGRD